MSIWAIYKINTLMSNFFTLKYKNKIRQLAKYKHIMLVQIINITIANCFFFCKNRVIV